MHPKNKHDSKKIDKDCKNKHTNFGGSYPAAGRIHSKYRAPRHPSKSSGNRIKSACAGCYCCTRSPKLNYVKRLKEKRHLIKN